MATQGTHFSLIGYRFDRSYHFRHLRVVSALHALRLLWHPLHRRCQHQLAPVPVLKKDSSFLKLITEYTPTLVRFVPQSSSFFPQYNTIIDNPLQTAVLNLFVSLKYRFPNLVVGSITRESVKKALGNGISAEQVGVRLLRLIQSTDQYS